ncbi:MAG: PorP/SprF family type IX secretion system membrane protein [Chitinophagales bacterium]
MRRIVIISFLLIALDQTLWAQDPAFSQFFASPLTLNPALTGKFSGVFRAAGNYRNQWPTINNAFITSTISLDGSILHDKLPETDLWGLGLMVMTDKTGNGILNSNYVALSTSYYKALDEDGLNQLGIGFQGTYASKRLDGTKLNFEDELDQQGGWTIPSAEIIDGSQISLSYFDFNAGALFNGSSNGANNYYLGASIYHINRPKESFTGNGQYTLHPRVTVHGGASFPLSSANSMNYIHFSGLFSQQANAIDFVFGGAWSVNLNNNDADPINLYLGTWARFNNLTDAIIPYVGLDFGAFTLGMSYDINVSSLKSASESVGGIEVSLIYIKKPSDGRKTVPCPKF